MLWHESWDFVDVLVFVTFLWQGSSSSYFVRSILLSLPLLFMTYLSYLYQPKESGWELHRVEYIFVSQKQCSELQVFRNF